MVPAMATAWMQNEMVHALNEKRCDGAAAIFTMMIVRSAEPVAMTNSH